jgi:hypothetical protein
MFHHVHIFDLGKGKISNGGCFVTNAELPADWLRFKNQRDKLKPIPVDIFNKLMGVAVYANKFTYTDTKTGFFPYFPGACFHNTFARVNSTSWQTP